MSVHQFLSVPGTGAINEIIIDGLTIIYNHWSTCSVHFDFLGARLSCRIVMPLETRQDYGDDTARVVTQLRENALDHLIRSPGLHDFIIDSRASWLTLEEGDGEWGNGAPGEESYEVNTIQSGAQGLGSNNGDGSAAHGVDPNDNGHSAVQSFSADNNQQAEMPDLGDTGSDEPAAQILRADTNNSANDSAMVRSLLADMHRDMEVARKILSYLVQRELEWRTRGISLPFDLPGVSYREQPFPPDLEPIDLDGSIFAGDLEDILEEEDFEEAVPDRPAPQAAVNQIEKKPYDWFVKATEAVLDGADCRICFEPFKEGDMVAALQCAHFFHPKCIELWLKKVDGCPFCRTEVTEMEEAVVDAEAMNVE